MRCTKCEFENPAGMKFCGKCRTALGVTYPNCSFENPPGFDFCGQCAAALQGDTGTAKPQSNQDKPVATVRVATEEASTTLEGERKTVTALFADIKGSTELEQDLDPEEARAIIDPALKLMIDAVRRYDGYIVQSTGDGIFALFGAPVAHEDHPQRALYAGLRMQEELKRYSARLREAGNLPIEARVGVNTGEVVVRSISTGGGHTEYTPIGHTTNLASRMQALAPTGSIAVSENTRRMVEGYFALKPLGPTKVKGVTEPVNVYEVTGLGPLRTRLQRSAGRGLSKFVGRDREMDALKHAADRAKSDRGQIVAAMAEAGTGKSRLFFEFKAKNQSGWLVLEAFSVSHGKASAYLPVIDLLHTYFDIKAEDDARKRCEKVNGKVLTLDRSLEDALPYLFALLGIVESDDPLAQMDGQVKKRRTLDAIKRILLRESLNQPLMVILEDLHWIDEETQAFLNLLADSIGTAKILLLVNSADGSDPLVTSLSWGSLCTWISGHPQRALQLAESAVTRSRDLSQPFSQAFALWSAADVHSWRGEVSETQRLCETLAALAEEGGFADWLAICHSLQGWVASVKGEHGRAIETIRVAIVDWGNPMTSTYLYSLLAEACLRAGRWQETMDAVAAGREHGLRTGEHHGTAEIERLAGETLLLMSPGNAAAAEQCVRRAIAVAVGQGAKSWELRATMSLARMLAKQGKRDEACTMLAEIYNWFTEGFDTADLKDAKAMLDELNG